MLRLISELSDQDANRWVAETLEPFVSLGMPRVIITDEPKPSPLGFWLAVEVYDEGDIARWQPRDFVTDPAMWSMLLEQMRDLHKIVTIQMHGMIYVTVGSETDPDARVGPTAPLGRAVVEAWMKSKGWAE